MSNRHPWLIFTAFGLICVGPSFAGEAKRQDKGAPKPAPNLIDEKTQNAIDAGLEFLAKNQHADGSWGTGWQKGSVAITSLAGLAFLAGGHKPGEGKYGKNITLALKFVVDQEDPALPGVLSHPKVQSAGPMYGHGFAAKFLADAQGLVQEPELRKKLDVTLSRAVKLIIDSQNREGGWRYRPKSADADISVTIVQIMALQAAGKAGAEIPKDVKEKYVKYVKECQDLHSGGFKYQRHVGRVGFARTAAGVFALQSAGLRDSDEVKKGLEFLKPFQPGMKEAIPDADTLIHYFYGHFYAAQAMQIAGGDRWHAWFRAIRDNLLADHGFRQKDGSWSDRRFCPHYCTAMALLILQTPRKDAKPK